MTESETVVKMGELAVSRMKSETLTVIGLGSCIGLFLLDRSHQAAGLAHVMLPSSQIGARDDPPAKFADRAVEELVEKMAGIGSRRSELEAILVGGARMFAMVSTGSGLDIGARNDATVREALERAKIPIAAACTGGEKGRTARVVVGTGQILCKEAGSTEHELFAGRHVASAAAREVPLLAVEALGGGTS